MKYDLEAMSRIELHNDVVSLYNVRKQSQYLYQKIMASYYHLVVHYEVETYRGRSQTIPFISRFILDSIKMKKENNTAVKRAFMGRPYLFCETCENKMNCSLDFPCERRDAYLSKRAQADKVRGDDRFWKNGVPKKRLVLCQSSKYKYAHKKTAGQCQEDKCVFYVGGKCELSIDKEHDM